MEIEFRSDLNDKIVEVVGTKGLTHSDVAQLAHTSRTRVTAILNRNTHDISTDLMLRVLASLARGAGETPLQERRLTVPRAVPLGQYHHAGKRVGSGMELRLLDYECNGPTRATATV